MVYFCSWKVIKDFLAFNSNKTALSATYNEMYGEMIKIQPAQAVSIKKMN